MVHLSQSLLPSFSKMKTRKDLCDSGLPTLKLQRFKEARSPSLAPSAKLKELQGKYQDALKALLVKETPEDEVFGETSTSDKKLPGLKNLKAAPSTVTILLNGIDVVLARPSSWKDKDLLVSLHSQQLTAVCDYILEDVSRCLERCAKRKYTRSGQFAKEKDAPEGEDSSADAQD